MLNASDFQAVFSWQPDENVARIRHTVEELGRYGPVMVAQYSGEGLPAPDVVDRDLRLLLTEESLAGLTQHGLFAWNFDNERSLKAAPGGYAAALDAVRRHGRVAR